MIEKSRQLWVSEKVFHSGDEYFKAMESDIARARHSIELETYIFSDDSLGRRICSGLKAAAARGIAVRVMVDGVGSSAWALRFLPELVEAGVEAKVFHPLPWIFWSASLIWRRGVSGILGFFRKVNRRNHRKVCIVDRCRAWVGSMNISANHVREYSGDATWRDTGVMVEGPAVVHLVIAFEKAWRRARGIQAGVRRGFFDLLSRRRRRRVPELVRLNNTRGLRRRHAEEFLFRLASARTRVWITTPYFVPAKAVARCLELMAARGVELRILVPSKCDVRFMRWVSIAYYEALIGSGARVFEYLPSVLHSKCTLIDNWVTVGSSNMNHRSLLHDLEVDILLRDPESIRSLEIAFVDDLRHSREVRKEDLAQIHWAVRLAGRLGLMFRYWL